MKKGSDLLSKYSDFMREQEGTDILEKIPENAVPLPQITYYMPYPSVIREDKSTEKL